jgi:hypothetical protein
VEQNPNRRGIIRATANGHALEYADGTPFFLIGDTHWSAFSFRYPYKGVEPAPDYVPSADIGYEETIQWLKKERMRDLILRAINILPEPICGAIYFPAG